MDVLEATSDGGRLALLALTCAVGAAGIVVACYVQRSHAKRERGRQKEAPGGTGLDDGIKEALLREAKELKRAPPDEALQEEFAKASAWVGEAGGSLSTEAKLGLYGCYKQFSSGDAPAQKPWGGMEASMKYDAWSKLRGTSRCDAMRKYVELLGAVAPTWNTQDPAETKTASGGHKPDGSSGMGLRVSTMGTIGNPDEAPDETPVGQLCAKIENGDIGGACELLLEQPRLAFQEDKDGMAPLHWAADRGVMDVARVLVQMACEQPTLEARAACLNARDGTGDTPLHYAVNTDNPELARLLVEAGADPSVENEDGETPASLAEGEEMAAVFASAR